MARRTVKRPARCEGVGLHTGVNSVLSFNPAPAGAGIYFVYKGTRIDACLSNVDSTKRGVCLSGIYTVEHVLSSVAGLGITDIEIALDGPEPPALDGSALGFVRILKSAGFAELGGESEIISPSSEITVAKGGSKVTAYPLDSLHIECSIDYSPSFVGKVTASFDAATQDFEKEVAPARTFGLRSEVEALRKAGLALGASVDNAVAIEENGYSSPLRFPDELARHKILDIIGDISLTGKKVQARIVSHKGGHELNIELARRILNAPS